MQLSDEDLKLIKAVIAVLIKKQKLEESIRSLAEA